MKVLSKCVYFFVYFLKNSKNIQIFLFTATTVLYVEKNEGLFECSVVYNVLTIPYILTFYLSLHSIHPNMSIRCQAKTILGKRCKLYCAEKYCHLHISPEYCKENDEYAELYSQKHEDIINTLKKLRRINDNEQIKTIVNSTLMTRIVECLNSDDSDIQFYACWVLTNFNGSQIKEVDEYIFTKQIYKLLVSVAFNTSYGNEMNIQSCWCLANFVGSNPIYTKAVLDYDTSFPYSAATIVTIPNVSQELRNVTMHLLNNMSLYLELNYATNLMTQLANIPLINLKASNDLFVRDFMKCISHLVKTTNKLETSLVPFIVERFTDIYSNNIHSKLAKDIIGDICEMNNVSDEIEALVKNNILYHFQHKIMDIHTRISDRQDMLWILSNLMCEPPAIQQIMKMPGFFHELIKIINEKEYNYDIIWIIGNIISHSTPEQLNLLIWSGVFQAFAANISFCKSRELHLVILESFMKSIKKNGELVLNALRYTNLQKKLESLSDNPYNEIRAYSSLIIVYINNSYI